MKKFLMGSKRNRIIASVLVFTLVITGLNWQNIVDAGIFDKSTSTELDDYYESVDGEEYEIVEERTENSNTYQLPDGQVRTEFFAQDIRYKDEDGKLVDYDSSLKKVTEDKSLNKNSLTGYSYETTTGNMKNYVPANLSEKTPIRMEKESKFIVVKAGETFNTTEVIPKDFYKA